MGHAKDNDVPDHHQGRLHALSSKELLDSVRLAHDQDTRIYNIRIYSKPNQRQRWGDTQSHPVVDYGDLFFDLFYVAAIYNLSYIIFKSPNSQGFLYFISCSWAVFTLWWEKTHYDSMFYTLEDIVHGIYGAAVLVVLASVVVHIRTVDVLSNPTDNVETFALCLSLLIANILSLCRYAEMLVFGCVGQHAAIIASRRLVLEKIGPILLLLVATIFTGWKYYNENTMSGLKGPKYRSLEGDMADSYGALELTDVPFYLILASSALNHLTTYISMIRLPNDFKSVTVPVNVTFLIHRFGEWTMLVLGESVLSLLVGSSNDTGEFYVTFFCGILSVIFLHYMHFRSQPSHADSHAIRRKRMAGFMFGILIQIYSAALIILGVSYKLFLYQIYKKDTKSRRSLLPMLPRWLAEDYSSTTVDDNDRNRRIAYFFTTSIAIVFLCSDAMLLVHNGLPKSIARCHCPVTSKIRVTGIVVIMLKVFLLLFLLTLSQWITDPFNLSWIGLISILIQIGLRIFSSFVYCNNHVNL